MQRPRNAELDRLFRTVEAFRATERKLDELKRSLADEARELAKIEDGDVRLASAMYAYWHAPEVNASDLSFGATGRTHPHFLRKLIGATSINVPCSRCNVDLAIRSRTEMKAVLQRLRDGTSNPRGALICENCQEVGRAEWHAALEKSDLERQKRAEALRRLPYLDYLKTPEWLNRRNEFLDLIVHYGPDAFQCETCDQTEGLGTYHRTLDRLGLHDDLILLCSTCLTALTEAGRVAGVPSQGNQVGPATVDRVREALRERWCQGDYT